MSQGSLFDFEPPPKLTERIFFAIAPDAQAIAQIGALTAQLKARHGMQGRAIADAKLHCTLCNLGDFTGMPDALLARATQAAALVAASTHAFSVSFDTAQTFINRARNRPFVLTGGDGVTGVTALYRNLAGGLLKAGISGNPASYTPHLTLLYDDVTAAPEGVEPVEWPVRELLLLHSHIGQARPYNVLARWRF
ncbi:2'-5' RNA ligase family protein [Duganella sp. sic0402]|uniref:2'-5' RNA ligase family protein n=1 Tax=Duganella sp. sic0402 TaxID=2854786 RepID=UPI001C44D75F|nr:2'-5' RNA ligase family protein [Duganella sp. sic0402]MBV7534844.1 2'-5' RNA ligase family protein [Duganella sp. sic0402]